MHILCPEGLSFQKSGPLFASLIPSVTILLL